MRDQIANQVSVAIHQSQLLNQLQKANDQLQYAIEVRNEELLRVITDEVRSSLQEDEILQAVVHKLTLGLQLSSCFK